MGEGEEEEEEEEEGVGVGMGVGMHCCGCGCGCGCGRGVVKEVGWGFEWRGWWWGLIEKSWMYGFLLILFRFLEDASCLCNLHKSSHCVLCLAIFPGSKIWSLFPSYDCSLSTLSRSFASGRSCLCRFALLGVFASVI